MLESGVGQITDFKKTQKTNLVQFLSNIDEKIFYDLARDEKYQPVISHYSFKVSNKELDSTNWMNGVDGGKKLNQINIPGSHDSTTYAMGKMVEKYSQCQKYTLIEQLEMGIRCFDIRLFSESEDIFCCHGKGVFQCTCYKEKGSDELISYGFVLSTIAIFLKEHSSETVIIAPKHESGPKELTIKYINLWHDVLKNFGLLFDENRVPSLDEVRGKIVLWNKRDDFTGGMKILTTKDSFIQENYANVDWKIQKKFRTSPEEKVAILEKFLAEVESKKEQNKFVGRINYTSGFKPNPVLPDNSLVSQKVNSLIKSHNFLPGYLYGWIIGDFVDSVYAREIFMSNFPFFIS